MGKNPFEFLHSPRTSEIKTTKSSRTPLLVPIGTEEAGTNNKYLSVREIETIYGVSQTNIKNFLQDHQERTIRRKTGKRGKPALLIRQRDLEELLKSR